MVEVERSNQDYARCITVNLHRDTMVYEIKFNNCVIATEADAKRFFDAIANRLEQMPPPRDLVFCLDGVEVGTAARRAYGNERARVARAYYRYSARYAGRSATKVTVMTSGVMHRIDGMVFDTLQQAIASILEARAAAKV